MGHSHKALVMKLCMSWRIHRTAAEAAMRSEIGKKESRIMSSLNPEIRIKKMIVF